MDPRKSKVTKYLVIQLVRCDSCHYKRELDMGLASSNRPYHNIRSNISDPKKPERATFPKHKSNHKDEKERTETSYKCKLCQKSFVQNHELIAHERKHSGKKPFSCGIFHIAGSASKSDVISRSGVHKRAKPYECEICQKTFDRRQHLSMHKRTHSGERLFECNICQKRFVQKSTLTRHARIHSGERLFSCGICQRLYQYRSCLLEHMRIHNGEGPYSCEICKKTFVHWSSLTAHWLIHSGETDQIANLG